MGALAMAKKKRERLTVYTNGGYKEKLEEIARALRAERLENVSLSDAMREAIDHYYQQVLAQDTPRPAPRSNP